MSTTTDEYFMKGAIKEAEIAAGKGDWPMGCVIVINEKIVARGRNQGYSTKNRLAHAELLAIEKVKDILEQNRGKATMYCTYEPCPMCFGAMLMSKIGRVVTGIDIDQSGGLGLYRHLPQFYKQKKFQIEIVKGILPDECLAVYKKGIPTQKHVQQYNIKLD